MLQVQSEKIPLEADENGVLRVSGTRVPLDAVVDLFDEGASPEGIMEQFDALRLDDVYAVITYYLRHHDDVQAHLAEEDRKSEETRKRFAQYSNNALRERFRKLKRRQDSGK